MGLSSLPDKMSARQGINAAAALRETVDTAWK
jgi:hypothetical protein